MSDAPKKNTFDEILQEATTAGLQGSITLTEKTTLLKIASEGSWQEANSSEVAGTGAIDKVAELKALQTGFETKGSEEGNNYNYDYPGFNFSFSLKKGDKLPSFGEIKKVGSDEKVVLQHKPGEVLLIDVWATWCGPCQKPMQHNQDMLTKNAEAWKDKVRIVGVSVDDTESTVQERIEKKKWLSIEHLTLGSWDNNHDLIKMFQISGIPFVCLINKEGIIDYIGHPNGGNLDKRIPELIAQEAAAPGAAPAVANKPDEKAGSLGVDSWNKFKALLEKLPAIPAGIESITVSSTLTRTYSNGKTTSQATPLIVAYRAEKEQATAYADLAKQIVESLSPNEYKINGIVNDPEAQFNTYYDRITEILAKQGLGGEPVITQTKTINVKDQNAWQTTKTLSYPNIPYKGTENFEKGDQVCKEFLDYLGEVQECNTSPIEPLAAAYPFKLVGSKFAGIHNLKDYNDGSPKEITAKEGVTQFILFYGDNNTSRTHIDHFLELLKKTTKKIHIHVIVFDGSKSNYIDDLKDNSAVSVYTGDHQENPDIKVTALQSYEHTIVVDGFGTVTKCGKFENYDSLESLVNDSQKQFSPEKNISPAFLEILEHLPEKEVFKTTQAQLKALPYRGSVNISFVEEFKDRAMKNVTAHSAKLIVKVRVSDKAIVAPLVNLFKPEAEVIESYIETVELPEGKNCADCGVALVLPYYYFHVSKVHKCVTCAEKQDKTVEDKLKRYPVNEHSVLIISDRTVDVKRLGKNIQPKTSEQCAEGSFMCNGCGNGANDEARYICMGCRREPNPRDLVDFCFECMKKCRGTDEEAIKQIVERNASEKHEKGHALLRVQWGPEGYYSF